MPGYTLLLEPTLVGVADRAAEQSRSWRSHCPEFMWENQSRQQALLRDPNQPLAG
jgi:hypothetical protein